MTTKKRRRIPCLVCHREIMQMSNGWLYRHYDGNGAVCKGGGTDPGQTGAHRNTDHIELEVRGFETDNLTAGVTGGPALLWPAPDPLILSVAHPGGGAAGLELAEWWANHAISEIQMVVRKAVEYGATDLRDLGEQVLEMAGRRPAERDSYDDTYATEVGIAFYAMGKLARIVAAVKEGRRPSADSWLDLGVYARMAQRVHETGGWPAGAS